MKTSYKTILTLIILALAIVNARADKEKYSRTITKNFSINKDAILHVENKFGKIHCTNWNKNEIFFEVEIEVESSKKEKADKILNAIKIDFSTSSSKVSAVTEFEKDDLNNVGELRIDYSISVPATVSLELGNKFGDVIIDETSAPASLKVSYGRLEANRLTHSDTQIEIKFGSALIDEMSSGNIEVQYAESFEIEQAGDLDIESKFSQLEVGAAKEISIESGYDGVSFGKISSLDCEADFSEFEIEFIANRLVLNIDYGKLVVDEVDKGFKLVEIENSFGEIKLGVASDASYSLEAEMKFGDLKYPKNNVNVSHEKKGYTTHIYKGTVGNGNPDARVVITSKNGNVTIND